MRGRGEAMAMVIETARRSSDGLFHIDMNNCRESRSVKKRHGGASILCPGRENTVAHV